MAGCLIETIQGRRGSFWLTVVEGSAHGSCHIKSLLMSSTNVSGIGAQCALTQAQQRQTLEVRLFSKEQSGPIVRGPYLTTLLVYTVTVTDSEEPPSCLSRLELATEA